MGYRLFMHVGYVIVLGGGHIYKLLLLLEARARGSGHVGVGGIVGVLTKASLFAAVVARGGVHGSNNKYLYYSIVSFSIPMAMAAGGVGRRGRQRRRRPCIVEDRQSVEIPTELDDGQTIR